MSFGEDIKEFSSSNEATTSSGVDLSSVLERLRSQLLDLTARNRLVNFRYTRRSLRFAGACLNGPYEALLDGKPLLLRYIPLPPDAKADEYPLAMDYAAKLGLPTSYDLESSKSPTSYLQALAYPNDLDRATRGIYKENQLAIDEAGSHVLFLVTGFLHYMPSEACASGHIAPLLLLPVQLRRQGVDPVSGLYTYHVEALDEEEEVRDNVTLREKLRREFGFQLSVYKEQQCPSDYLQEVSEACGQRKGWTILPHLSLVILSFKKIALWADLDIQKDQMLVHNPLMKKLLGDEVNGSSNEGLAEEYSVDDHPLAELPFVYDADSSQHSALIDALEGKNLVVIGPPGTGKSQTITNLIAAAMGRGKTVLFISDKKAALDVVSKRIEAAGLGPFCLELHSNKSCKKLVLASLEKRLNQQFPAPKNITGDLRSLREMRHQLNSYSSLMNKVVDAPGELSVHDIFWKVERARQSLGSSANELRGLWWSDASQWKDEDLSTRRQTLTDLGLHYDRLGGDLSSHPLVGISIKSFSPVDRYQMEQYLQNGMVAASGLLDTFATLWGDNEPDPVSIDNCSQWLTKLTKIPSFACTSTDHANSFEPRIQDVSSNTILDALALVQTISSNLLESSKLLKTDGDLDDVSLTQSPIDDFPVSRLVDLTQNLALALSKGGGLLPSSSFADLGKVATWFLRGERHIFLPLSLEIVEALLTRLSVIFSRELDPVSLEVRNHGPQSYADLVKNIKEAEELSERLDNGLRSLCPLREGLELKEPKKCILDFLMICHQIFESAPPSFFSFRELRGSLGDATDMTEIVTEAETLIKEQSKLSTCFHFDMLPTTNELEGCLRSLREINWWSFISRRIFKAKKMCNGLFQQDASIDYSSKELDQLLEWCKRRDIFLSDPSRRKLFEECFIEGSKTRKDLAAFSHWRDSSLLRLTNASGGIGIDLFMIPDDTLHHLKQSKDLIRELVQINASLQRYRSILVSFYQELEILSSLANSVAVASTTFNELVDAYHCLTTCRSELATLEQPIEHAVSWSNFRSSSSALLSKIEIVLRHFQPLAHPLLTPRQVKSAVNARQRIADLVTRSHANELLAPLAFSIGSLNPERLDLLEKMLVWHLEVKESSISPSLKRKLLAQPRELGPLCACLQQAIIYEQQWKSAVEELQQLCSVDHNQWSFPESGITSNGIRIAKSRFEKALSGLDCMDAWVAFNRCKEAAISLDLSDLVHRLESGLLSTDQLVFAFDYVYYHSCVHDLYKRFPDLSREVGYTLDGVRQRFSELDRKIIRLNGARLAADIAQRQIPEGRRAARASEQTELVLLKHEMAKTCRHLPIRKLMMQAGLAIQSLKPCFLMSPLSVAQFLPRSSLAFDLLVIDEASQMRLPEAFGAILRSKQIVVVGDSKQLPPSSFFEQGESDAEENDDLGSIEDGVQSILDRCLQVFKNPRHLRWHYRSQHQSLIDFSNYHFYDNRLIILPACHPSTSRIGVYYNYIPDSVYLDRRNRIEAERVVEAVISQLLTDSTSSVGVVTLNQPQREVIDEMFEQKLREIPSLREVVDQFEARGQDVFIKNLESVQGDERDIVFISTVYGKTPGSTVVRQTFGPINGSSGWRRLNVLFTRARQRIELFTSMQPEDVVLGDQSSRGHRTLKHYLEFAQNRQLTPLNPSAGETENPFEEAIADLLQRSGYEVHPQLGVQGYWIDLAVRHPERPGEYLAAIECDGATYHSSRSARDRDRIRQQLLETLGWKGKIFRIWSTDWFTNPTKQADRLLDFLASLRFPKPVEN